MISFGLPRQHMKRSSRWHNSPSTVDTPLSSHCSFSQVFTMALTVGIVVFPNVTTLDFVGPASYLEALPTLGRQVEFYSISDTVGQVQDSHSIPAYSGMSYDEAPDRYDILLIPGGPGSAVAVKD